MSKQPKAKDPKAELEAAAKRLNEELVKVARDTDPKKEAAFQAYQEQREAEIVKALEAHRLKRKK